MKNTSNALFLNLATCFRLGSFPFSGIIGTIIGLGLSFFLSLLQVNHFQIIIIMIILILVSAFSANKAILFYNVKDPPQVIVDEVIGVMLAISLISKTPINYFLVFIIFRVIDNLKPFPINLINQKTVNGWGIIADDILAGIITSTIVIGINYLFIV